jgi:HK97 family phage prohead protease
MTATQSRRLALKRRSLQLRSADLATALASIDPIEAKRLELRRRSAALAACDPLAATKRGEVRRRSVACQFKGLEGARPEFSLYGAVFGNVDRQNEVCAPGCFVNLAEFVRDGWLDVNHEWENLGIGVIDSATQDAHGLKVSGRFHSTPDAQAIRAKIRERMLWGKNVQCSIGYRVLDGATEMRDGKAVFVIKAAEVFEVSVVNLPANPLAMVSESKAGRC